MAENSIAVAERLEREHSGQEVGIIATLYLASRDRIAQLEKREVAWKLLRSGYEEMLAAYRTTGRVKESTWKKLAKAKKVLDV